MDTVAFDYYQTGQMPMGVRTLEDAALTDPAQQRDVVFRVHYPAENGPHPVIVYSHGALCSVASYDRLAAYWAARGYVVVVPEHLDAAGRPGAAPMPDLQTLLSTRVRDLSFAVDAVPELAAAAGMPDLFSTRQFAVGGHSFGALTAMIKTGVKLQPGMYQFDGPTADERFVATVSMSGVGLLPPMTDDAFSGLTGPLIATGGTLDEGNVGAGPVHPWEWRLTPFALSPAGDKFRLVLELADHYFGGLMGRDEPGENPDPEGLAIVAATTTAFLDAYLHRSEAARDWLVQTDLAALTEGRATLQEK